MVNALTLMFIPPVIVVCLPFHMVYSIIVTGIFGSCMALTYWPWLAWKSLVLVATSQRVGPFARSLMMLPWLLLAATAPILALTACVVSSVLIGFASACVAGWVLIDDGDCAGSVEFLKDLLPNTIDAISEFGTSAQEEINSELAFRNPRTPIDLNPIHIVEGILGWLIIVVPAVLAAVVMAFTKMIINILGLVYIAFHLLTDIDAEYIPCLCCCLPLLVAALFGLMPAALLAAAALSPLVALCCSAIFATKAVYVSYLAHYDVPQGTRVSCYWPVLHRAAAGGLYSISVVDELYTTIPNYNEADCCSDFLQRLRSHGLYNEFFFNAFRHIAEGVQPGTGATEALELNTGATAPPAPPADEPQLERQGSSTFARFGNAFTMASVWRSFFDSCESAGALALVEGWVSLDAVRGADPSVFVGVPALVVVQAALRSVDAGEERVVVLADGRQVRGDSLPDSAYAREVHGQMVQLIGAVRELQPNNEERTYLQAMVACGGDEGGVRMPMPLSLGGGVDAAAAEVAASDATADTPAGGEGKESDAETDAAAAAAGSGSDEGNDAAGAELRRRQAALRTVRNVATQLGLSATRQGAFRRKFARVLASIGGS